MPPAAIFGAVNDALRKLGGRIEVAQTPLTPRRLLEAIESAKQQASRGDA